MQPKTPKPVDVIVGKNIRRIRSHIGLSQTALGDALGITFQQIQKYEKGANRISASKLWDIARFFKVDIGYFFDGLGGVQPGMADDGAPAFDHDFPATRYTIEIARLAPQLPVAKQKLALELIRSLSGSANAEGES